MKRYLNRNAACAIVLSLLLLIMGCGTQNLPQVSPYNAVYSNLVDRQSQEVLRAALEDAGVQKTYVDVLLESVAKYNDAVGSILPVKNGFEVFTINSASVYDADKLKKKWKKEYNGLTGRKNCRITAYEAMGSLISYDSSFEMTEPLLLVEIEDSTVFQSKADIEKFSVLFNGIETYEDIGAALQAEQVIEYWSQAGIDFSKSNKISLISIWFNGSDLYNNDNERYILHCGHAAVLIYTENDGVLLLEKLDYNFPYQLIKFPSEELALKYIVEFNCGEIKDSAIIPIVFVNDQLLRTGNDRLVY